MTTVFEIIDEIIEIELIPMDRGMYLSLNESL